MDLATFFRQHPKAALGLSGGVDSVYLLYAAMKSKADVKAYYVNTPFQPAFELEDAKRAAAELGAELRVIDLDILSDDKVRANPENRCYYCKKRIFTALADGALKDGYTVLLDGTNASDDAADRPGMKAIRELQVLSPLREAGLTKSDVRRLSKEAGLFTWDKPSYACLATRITAGEEITEEKLATTEKAEELLRNMGFRDFRIRLVNGMARLQFTIDEIERAFAVREDICKALDGMYDGITLDMEARRGTD